MVKRSFVLGMIFAFLLVGCASFKYHYYGLGEVIFDHGKLLGPKAADDLPFSKCAPNASSRNPCVVMFAADFFAFKKEYEDVVIRLKDCEKKP